LKKPSGRWIALAAIFVLFGFAAIHLVNGESEGATAISVGILRQGSPSATPRDQVLMEMNRHGGHVVIRVSRLGATKLVIALSDLKAALSITGAKASPCSAAALGEWNGLNNVAVPIRYEPIDAVEKEPLNDKAVSLYGSTPHIVVLEIPAEFPDKITVTCELDAQPIHRTFVKREYRVAPWVMWPLAADIQGVVEKKMCSDPTSHCLVEDPPGQIRLWSEFSDFPTTDGKLELPVLVAWSDESASQWRDVLLLLAGTLLGTAGACFLESLRPIIEPHGGP
jgi:hypothetical protein